MKKKLTKDWLLENIYNLILDTNTPQSERELMLKAKMALENNDYYIPVAKELVSDISHLAINRKLSSETIAFYMALQKSPQLHNKIGPNTFLFF